MKIYNELSKLFKNASSFKEQDMIINTFVKVAQMDDESRMNPEAVTKMRNQIILLYNTLLKQKTAIDQLQLENLQLKGSQTPENVKVEPSSNLSGATNFMMESPTDIGIIGNQGNQQTNQGLVNNFGQYVQNAPNN